MIQRTIDIKTAPMAAFEKESKRLLLCLEEDRLVIILAEKSNGQWNALENFTMATQDWENMAESLIHVKQQSSLANLRVGEAHLFFRTEKALPVPATLKQDNKLFLQAQFGFNEPDEMLTNEVNNTMNVLMVIPAAQVSACRHVFPQATWHSTLASLIKQAQMAQGKTMLPQLYITISSSLAEIVFMKNDALLIAHCFKYFTAENLLYHLINTCNQLGISPAEVFIKVQGLINTDDEIYTLLHQYFSNVELLSAGTQTWSEAFKDVPAHYFTNLMTSL